MEEFPDHWTVTKYLDRIKNGPPEPNILEIFGQPDHFYTYQIFRERTTSL